MASGYSRMDDAGWGNDKNMIGWKNGTVMVRKAYVPACRKTSTLTVAGMNVIEINRNHRLQRQ